MKRNIKKSKSKQEKQPVSELFSLNVDGMISEETERFQQSLQFFKICNRAAFEIAMATYSVSSGVCPYSKFIFSFEKSVRELQDKYVSMIEEYHNKLEFGDDNERE